MKKSSKLDSILNSDKFNSYNDKYINSLNISNSHHKNISSDLSIIFILIKDLLLYIILLIPYILLFIFSLLSGNSIQRRNYFEKIFLEPFRLIEKFNFWFFEAKYTASIILFLIFMYLVEVFYFSNIEGLMHVLMTHQLHFTQGNYISVLTSVFLHADLIHLLSNCLAFLIFGRIVEREFGYKMIFIFLFSGIVSNIVSNYISYLNGDLYYSLGASGAIAGIIIFAILLSPFSFTSFFIIPIPIFLLGWFLIVLDILGINNPSQTNHLAHLAGYSTLLISFFFLELKNRRKVISGFMINLFLLLLIYIISKFYDLKELVLLI